MGEQSASARLINQLQEAHSVVDKASHALSLARLGDRQAIDSLVDLTSPDRTIFERSCAMKALGALAEPSPLPWHAQVSVNSNYLLPLSIQGEIAGSF